MRKILSFVVAVLMAGTVSACEQQPTELQQTEASADAAPRSQGTFTRPTWANGHLWEFQRNQPVLNQGKGNEKFVFINPTADIAQRPFYVVGYEAGDDGKQSTLFFGGNGHDHVTTAPGSEEKFRANVQLFVVTRGPEANEANVASTSATNFFTGEKIELAYAADVDGDGTLEEFTDVETVEQAAKMGLVKLGTTFEETVLTMHDIDG